MDFYSPQAYDLTMAHEGFPTTQTEAPDPNPTLVGEGFTTPVTEAILEENLTVFHTDGSLNTERLRELYGLGVEEAMQEVEWGSYKGTVAQMLDERPGVKPCPVGKVARDAYKENGIDGVAEQLDNLGKMDPKFSVKISETTMEREREKKNLIQTPETKPLTRQSETIKSKETPKERIDKELAERPVKPLADKIPAEKIAPVEARLREKTAIETKTDAEPAKLAELIPRAPEKKSAVSEKPKPKTSPTQRVIKKPDVKTNAPSKPIEKIKPQAETPIFRTEKPIIAKKEARPLAVTETAETLAGAIITGEPSTPEIANEDIEELVETGPLLIWDEATEAYGLTVEPTKGEQDAPASQNTAELPFFEDYFEVEEKAQSLSDFGTDPAFNDFMESIGPGLLEQLQESLETTTMVVEKIQQAIESGDQELFELAELELEAKCIELFGRLGIEHDEETLKLFISILKSPELVEELVSKNRVRRDEGTHERKLGDYQNHLLYGLFCLSRHKKPAPKSLGRLIISGVSLAAA
ncbi:MAG TPA: hypothetical protein VLE74_00780 [Candidatus Saccharimonadales bacterium]|nr:hypothetical protein [Candidatus Saccharimonadales bacterium]